MQRAGDSDNTQPLFCSKYVLMFFIYSLIAFHEYEFWVLAKKCNEKLEVTWAKYKAPTCTN